MDALSSAGDFRCSAAALLSVVLVMSIGGAAPFNHMTFPSEWTADGGSTALQWFPASPMAFPRSSPQVVELPDGDILVIGGLSTNGPTKTTEVYEPASDSWRPGPNMNTARVGHTATLLGDGTVLVTGGETGSGVTPSAELLDLARNACLYVSDMSFSRSGHAAAILGNSMVLVTGGTDWANGVWKQAEVYDPSSHSFLPAGNMNYGRLFLTLQPLPDGRALAIGGDAQGTSEAYDPARNSWGTLSTMSSKRYSASSVALEGGDVLVAGGVADDTVLSSVEVYSADLDIWVSSEGMGVPRANFGLAVAESGRMVATGSWSTLGATDTSESLCTCDFTWRAGPSMATARGMHGTAVTANGTVLAIGGWDGSRHLSSVEMLVDVEVGPPPGPKMCEPIDLLPLVLSVADEMRGHSENGLIAKLFAAQTAYELGLLGLCLDIMEDFYNQVHGLSHSGHLSDEGISMLYDGYAEVVECLGGEPLPPIP